MTLFNPDTTGFKTECYPASATGYYGALNTSASADTYGGTYTELVPASTVTSDSYIVGVFIKVTDISQDYRLKLATGAALSEVDLYEIVGRTPSGTGNCGWFVPIPRKKLAADTRLSYDAMDTEAAVNAVYVSVMLEVPA